ncbi:MAG: class II aldolase/adducin family protein [Deltaproteobacteria bacterium]|jgi:L-fuculose-phosphate aldolase|nr:class II aldolase/adducin family protein [Deltaproteobacteria bacterium]
MTELLRRWKTEDKAAMADVCHRLYDRGYLVATSGNVSIRTDEGFLITPAMTRKDLVKPDSIVPCDSAGNTLDPSKRPSSEIAMHREVYALRDDIGAAIHAHPHYCLACSLTEIPLTEMLLPELAIYIGPVPLVPYATPGTDEMAEVLVPVLPKHNAFLLNRHGVLVLGQDLQDAYNRLEHLEHMARVAYLVSSTSGIEPLTKNELRKLTKQARTLGQHISETLLDFLE